jgi:hypothetical protein
MRHMRAGYYLSNLNVARSSIFVNAWYQTLEIWSFFIGSSDAIRNRNATNHVMKPRQTPSENIAVVSHGRLKKCDRSLVSNDEKMVKANDFLKCFITGRILFCRLIYKPNTLQNPRGSIRSGNGAENAF